MLVEPITKPQHTHNTNNTDQVSHSLDRSQQQHRQHRENARKDRLRGNKPRRVFPHALPSTPSSLLCSVSLTRLTTARKPQRRRFTQRPFSAPLPLLLTRATPPPRASPRKTIATASSRGSKSMLLKKKGFFKGMITITGFHVGATFSRSLLGFWFSSPSSRLSFGGLVGP